AHAEQKLRTLEETIRSLRLECAAVLKVKERIGEGIVASAAKAKHEREIIQNARSRVLALKVVKWAKEAAEFFVHAFRCFNGKAELFIEEDYFKHHEDLLSKLKKEGTILTQELFRRFKEEGFFFCSFCDRFLFSFRLTCMHIGNVEHANKMGRASPSYQRMNYIIVEMVEREHIRKCYDAESELLSGHAERWMEMSLDDPELRPTKEYIDDENQPFLLNWQNHGNIPCTKAEFAQHLATKFTENPGVVDIMIGKLIKHIGQAKTRCFTCKLIFDNGVEYFKHLISFYHIREVGMYDSITFTVNLHLTRYEKLTEL
ncbi:hypothetical protein PMAYCL1PPCAC_00564, partial [Pristionchus mayeri]